MPLALCVFSWNIYGYSENESPYIVTVYDKTKTYDGVTYFQDLKRSDFIGVDMEGKIVWRHHLSFVSSRLGIYVPKPAGIKILDNGNAIVTIGFYGHREIDPNGRMVWEFRELWSFHEVDLLPNGNILYPRWHKDDVIEADRDGNIIWT